MKKNIIIGIIILVLAVGGALFYQIAVKKESITVGNVTVGGNTASIPEYQTVPNGIELTGTGGYKLEKVTLDGEEIPVIRIPLVTWGGYAALVAANANKLTPNKESLFYKNGKFVVELIHEENPELHLQGYAQGKYPIIWSTMDTMPLLYNATSKDKRVLPQVLGVFDWSFGGDGIIVRGDIKTPKDLKGKKIVTSGNTPSNFFLLWLLANSGLSPSDLNIQYVADAVLAKDSFIADKTVDACVTWSPFLYEITDPSSSAYVDGSRLLITSKDANQLIADIYLSRADFYKEQSVIVNAFVKSMMQGWDSFNKNSEATYLALASLFELPGNAAEAKLMVQDVHIANMAENMMFFDLENPISAYSIFYMSQEYYKGTGSLPQDASYSSEVVIGITPLEILKKSGEFANQQNTLKDSFNSQNSFSIADLEDRNVVLSEDIHIQFDTQRIDFDFDSNSETTRINKVELKKIADQMQVLGTTIVKLVGHLDTTKVEEYKKQGNQVYIQASASARLLSKQRAEFIKKILVEKYKCDPNRIITEGKGWEQPVDSVDQTANRRVEVKFLSFE